MLEAIEPVALISSIWKSSLGIGDNGAVAGLLRPVIVLKWDAVLDLVEGGVDELISFGLADQDQWLLGCLLLLSFSGCLSYCGRVPLIVDSGDFGRNFISFQGAGSCAHGGLGWS